MSSNPVRIGIACPLAGERAAFQEWLKLAGYEPVAVTTIESVVRELPVRPLEALVADVSLVPASEFPRVVKMLGANRPLILVGNPDEAIEDVPRDATWISRPIDRDLFQLSIALALAEGRPARRSPRKLVPDLFSTIDGVQSKLVDISNEGLRLEIPGSSNSALPPYFILKVPSFGVAARVKRVWVATPGPDYVWCGGVVERHVERGAATTWPAFVQAAPTGKKGRGGQQRIVQVD